MDNFKISDIYYGEIWIAAIERRHVNAYTMVVDMHEETFFDNKPLAAYLNIVTDERIYVGPDNEVWTMGTFENQILVKQSKADGFHVDPLTDLIAIGKRILDKSFDEKKINMKQYEDFMAFCDYFLEVEEIDKKTLNFLARKFEDLYVLMYETDEYKNEIERR